jgi:hypothetical protein
MSVGHRGRCSKPIRKFDEIAPHDVSRSDRHGVAAVV